MNKISAIDFWAKYSKEAISFYKHPELPLKLNLGLFFNVYFGKLTHHKFLDIKSNHVELMCENCIYINQPSAQICDTHIGIIKGQFDKKENCQVYNHIENNVCRIVFDATE
jgi:hypothetical protein